MEKVVLFGGSLSELNSFTRKQGKEYEIANINSVIGCSNTSIGSRDHLKNMVEELGYDGAIRVLNHDHESGHLDELYWTFGIPIKLKKLTI